MTYVVTTGRAEPRLLAAARARTTGPQLAGDIRRLLDKVWPVLRQQGVQTGHNVVIYYNDGDDGSFAIEAGVETITSFTPTGEVQRTATPAGEAASTAHCGEYSQLGAAYAAVTEWCTGNGRKQAGVTWEVYGDWAEDPADLRTDVFFLLSPADAGKS
jgi:effector-binding domain-containing protein